MKVKNTDILVIGGGASGFFAATSAAAQRPGTHITLIEKSSRFLAKVKVSGGGRCNVTCGEEDPKTLAGYYPRGGRMLSRLYFEFGPREVKQWFESRGVRLKTEADGRVFPVTDSSQTIIECLIREAVRQNIECIPGADAIQINPSESGYEVQLRNGELIRTSKVIVATGGSPKKEGLIWLKNLGHGIIEPVPSLFTFNSPGHSICKLMGVSVPQARVKIAGTKHEYAGPLLITHWGLSGPAVLKLSAFAARDLAEIQYNFTVLINWKAYSRPEWEKCLDKMMSEHPKKQLGNISLFGLPSSLRKFILSETGISNTLQAGQLGPKQYNKLLENLSGYTLPIKGKTTFKEEFVTAGGVSLDSVNPQTMESKTCPGLFFAGEILDLDGITGGYNFQAAWTTGYTAGKNAAVQLMEYE
jgi:predicted Rossmann fold flavoprotein